MISKKLEEALNKQINAEFWSAYLYMSMSAYFKGKNLNGFSHWMRVQAMEETTHAVKFFDYLIDRGGKVNFQSIAEVKKNWKNVIDVFEETQKHEHIVSKLINELTDLATKEKDYPTLNVLQWFISEQVEEEATVDNILQQLKMINGEGQGLLLFDRELMTRVFVDSTQSGNRQ